MWKNRIYFLSVVLVFCLAALSGCGGGGSNANVVKVSVSPASDVLIVSQSVTLTATVTGATNTNVTWSCAFTTTTITNGTPTTKDKNKDCKLVNGDVGVLSDQQNTTVTFTAPTKIPDPTTYPNLVVTITATSVQDTKVTGLAQIGIDSGISVVLSPTTATVPTKEAQEFTVTLTNDNDPKTNGVTWLVTQGTPNPNANPPLTYPNLTTCTVSGNATGCGSITSDGPNSAKYTAPNAVPSTATLTVVATSKADPTRFATGTITIIAGGPITFNGISPTFAPQGASSWDIFLNAPNISSSSVISLQGSTSGSPTPVLPAQVKVLFPIPTSTTANPTSTGARIRLIASNLGSADTFTVSVTDAGQTVTTSPTGVFKFTVVPVRPSLLASVPDSLLQGTFNGNTSVFIDGGYFGPSGTLANVTFQGNSVFDPSAGVSSSRQLQKVFQTSGINSGNPGLYQLGVGRTTPPLPNPNNSAISTIGVFPDYSTYMPVVVGNATAGTNPSAIDIDPELGIAVVADATSNDVKFYTIGTGSLSLISTVNSAAGASINLPTGVSVNRANHTVAVANYGDQSVTVLQLPNSPTSVAGVPFNISLANLIPGTAAPRPYSIGVDPDTNMALVAYSSSTISSPANLGFIVNLNTGTNPYGCITKPTPTAQCVYAQVTLNTGSNPQIAMAPHGHLAFVTPGGLGVVRGVDVTKASTSVGIASVSLTSGAVTVTTSAAHNLNPGNPGTVLISGVTSASGQTNFNGAFSVISVLGPTQFIYALTSTINDTGTGGIVNYSDPNLIFGGPSQTTQGIAINPITRMAALADANATGQNGSQIDLLSSLDQSVTSITFFANCTANTKITPCSNTPELLGTTAVAWQPYSNALVSYNAQQNQVSISDPVTRLRFAFACNPTATCSVDPIHVSDITLSGTGVVTLKPQNGGTNTLNLNGALAVDPATNQAFVVKSGSGDIDIVNLGPKPINTLKTVQITEIVIPSPNPGLGVIGGIPNALVPQGTLTSANNLAGVQIYGSGFVSGSQVRLDGTDITTVSGGSINVVSSRQITATIPKSFLATPHRYALDVISSGAQSNASEFLVVQSIDMTKACTSGTPTPSSVAIADQLGTGTFSPIAVVTNSGCNNISIIDINPASPTFGAIKNTIGVGSTPQGIALSQRFGLAVVANNGAGTASVIDLVKGTKAVPDVTTGTNPIGVAMNDSTAAAVVTNFGSNSVSEINLAPLFASTPATTLTAIGVGVQQPIAVAIDPDRGSNNRGLAVVTALQLISGSSPLGALQAIDIGGAAPVLSTTASTGTVSSTPTGLVFNPAVATGTANPGLFYANSSGANVISSFNPDTGGSSSASVGINPTGLAINPQTGAILTSNTVGKSISIVDTTSNPIKTRQTIGIPGSPQFGVAIDQFTNLAVIVDQANNRVLLFPMP